MEKGLSPLDSHDSKHLLSLSPRPRSSLSPTPRLAQSPQLARSHTPITVRFSDQAGSYNYTLSFEESSHRSRSIPDLTDSHTVPSNTGLSYTDTFVSEVTSSSIRSRRSLSDSSLYRDLKSISVLSESDIRQPSSETVEYSSSQSDTRTKLSSHGTSQKSAETVIESQRWLQAWQGDDTQTSLHTRYDYSQAFEASNRSLSEEEDTNADLQAEAEEENARLGFVQNLVTQLKLKSSEGRDVTVSPPPSPTKHAAKLEINETESKYCRRKMKLLKTKKKFGHDYKVTKEGPAVKESVSITEYGFRPSVIDKLKTKSFMAAMENASKVQVHDPKHCKECRRHWKSLKEREEKKHFVREKTVELQRKTMEDKISRHLANMDSITLIGDIMRNLPKASDPAEDINRWLSKPLLEHNRRVTRLSNTKAFDLRSTVNITDMITSHDSPC